MWHFGSWHYGSLRCISGGKSGAAPNPMLSTSPSSGPSWAVSSTEGSPVSPHQSCLKPLSLQPRCNGWLTPLLEEALRNTRPLGYQPYEGLFEEQQPRWLRRYVKRPHGQSHKRWAHGLGFHILGGFWRTWAKTIEGKKNGMRQSKVFLYCGVKIHAMCLLREGKM